MSNKQIYNIGTAVYYDGDSTNRGGFGTITAHAENYLGELELEITLEDGRRIVDVGPADFDGKTVLGNTASPEFYLAEGELVQELGGFEDAEDDETDGDIKEYRAWY